ncbi:peptidase [Symbiopectobacterium sp. RP]|uniref:peptidase n=1 Tax=Symbiopectobacterium sp. RP TaxID=3248553 RepID=UPI003D2BD723
MSTLHIFKAGTHTDMHGRKIDFSESMIGDMVQAYDPSLHEAPIVVEHSRTDDPAYGWVKRLSTQGRDVLAEPHEVDPAFAELVANKRFKKISSSFYTPDSPSNPKPGIYYLRHVGFLGAQPPAIKGLKTASFAKAEEGVVEFADWGLTTSASMFARLRDFFIEKFGREAADEVIPGWQIDALRDAAQIESASRPAFTEFSTAAPAAILPPNTEDNTVDEKEKQRLTQQNADLKRQFDARRQADSQARQQAVHHANAAFADDLVTHGRLAPAARSVMVAMLNFADAGEEPVSYTEGSITQPLGEAFRSLLKSAAPLVDFSEVATKDRRSPTVHTTEFADADPVKLALHQKAQALATSENISYEAAVKRCL